MINYYSNIPLLTEKTIFPIAPMRNVFMHFPHNKISVLIFPIKQCRIMSQNIINRRKNFKRIIRIETI